MHCAKGTVWLFMDWSTFCPGKLLPRSIYNSPLSDLILSFWDPYGSLPHSSWLRPAGHPQIWMWDYLFTLPRPCGEVLIHPLIKALLKTFHETCTWLKTALMRQSFLLERRAREDWRKDQNRAVCFWGSLNPQFHTHLICIPTKSYCSSLKWSLNGFLVHYFSAEPYILIHLY